MLNYDKCAGENKAEKGNKDLTVSGEEAEMDFKPDGQGSEGSLSKTL